MAYRDALIAELKYGSDLTKKMLERVPVEKGSWRPHEKSMTLARIARHVAEVPHCISRIIAIDDWDFIVQGFSSHSAASKEELMKTFQDKLQQAIADLEGMSDEDFNKTWIVRRGDQMRRELPNKVSILSWGFIHLIH